MLCGRIECLLIFQYFKSITVTSAATSDNVVSGANIEPQAAIHSVILMKTSSL